MALPKPQPGSTFFTNGVLDPPSMKTVYNTLVTLHFHKFQVPIYEISVHLDHLLSALKTVAHAQGVEAGAPFAPPLKPKPKTALNPEWFGDAPGDINPSFLRRAIIIRLDETYESLVAVSQVLAEVSALAAALLSKVARREATTHRFVPQASPTLRMPGRHQGNYAG